MQEALSRMFPRWGRRWNIDNPVPKSGIGAFSPAGDILTGPDHEGTIPVWSTATQKQIGSISAGTGVYDVAFNSTGTVLATTGDNSGIRLWNTTTRTQLAVIPAGTGIYNLAFDSAGTMIADVGAHGIQLWNPTNLKQIGTVVPISTQTKNDNSKTYYGA